MSGNLDKAAVSQASLWVSYVHKDSHKRVSRLREELAKISADIEINTFETRIDGKSEYVLVNGQRIEQLTEIISRSRLVVFLLSERFPESKYCCQELSLIHISEPTRPY